MRSFPLSPGQESLYFLSQLAPDSCAYNVVVAGAARPSLDDDRLRFAAAELCRRHPLLQVVFGYGDQGLEQTVLEPGGSPLRFVPAREGSHEARQAQVLEEAQRPFDLSRGPLFRLTCFRGADGDVLLVALHHAVLDLWSAAILLDELGRLYDGFGGPQADLGPPATDYARYVAELARRLESPAGREHLGYWLNTLQPPPPRLALAHDWPRPRLPGLRGGTVQFSLPAEARERLERFARDEGTTLFAVLYSAFQALLSLESQEEDVVVSTVVHGRRPAFHKTLGLFINTLPIRSRLALAGSFRAHLVRVSEQLSEAFAHWETPLRAILEGVHADTRLPLTQFQFLLQQGGPMSDEGFSAFSIGLPGAEFRRGRFVLEAYPLPSQEGQFELQLAAYAVADGLTFQLKYDAELFKPERVQALGQRYLRLLSAASEDAERPLQALAAHSQRNQ